MFRIKNILKPPSLTFDDLFPGEFFQWADSELDYKSNIYYKVSKTHYTILNPKPGPIRDDNLTFICSKTELVTRVTLNVEVEAHI